MSDTSGVRAEARLEPIRHVELAPVITGTVSEVLVDEGAAVQAGDLLVRLDAAGAQSLETARNEASVELGRAHGDLRTASQRLDDYPVPRVFAGLTPEVAARSWLAELDAARLAFEPYKDTSRKTLKPSHTVSPWVYPSLPRRVVIDTNEYDEVALVFKKRLDVAWMNYTKAVEWLTLDSAVAKAQARVDEAQRRYDGLQDDKQNSATAGTRSALASAEIRAPFDGTVASMNVKVGEVLTAGIPAVTIADVSGWVVRTTDLTEIDVTSIQVGTPAVIVFDTMPGQELAGRVASIDLTYADRQGDVVYPVEILLGTSEPWLRWGMTAEVTFGT
ncbi:MAG TPA: efflux RND transporter periplasmic adaptor subunit [Anaerolineales bacterium]|nr:efflux RND transporter periplasmic adaptor subunit [Anaerolineales bacterium]